MSDDFSSLNNAPDTMHAARLSWRLLVGVGIAIAVILALAAYSLWQSRENLQREAVGQAENQTNLLERYVYAAIHESDLALQVSADEYKRSIKAGKADRLLGESYSRYLETLRERLPKILSLRATDETGLIKYGEGIDPAQPVNIADCDHFRIARESPGLTIAAPFFARISQQWVLPLDRRLETADGRFAGIVYASIQLEQFSDLFASLLGASHGAVILFDANTNIYVRHPEPKGPGSALGLKIGSPQFKNLWQQGYKSATYRAQSTTDGIWRTYSYRQVGDYPLYIMVGLAEEDYLAPWKVQLAVTAVFLAVLGLLVALLSRSLGRSLRAQQQSNHFLSSLLNAIPLPVFYKDAEGRYLGLNTAFEKFYGQTKEELIGKSVFDIAPKALAEIYHAHDLDLMHHKGTQVYESKVIDAQGNVHEVIFHKASFADSAGKVRGLIGAVFDITERKQNEADLEQHRCHLEELVQQRTAALTETEAKASHILQSSADGLYGVDCAGLITVINPAACQMLGYRAEQVVGHSAHALFHHSKPDGAPYPVEECPSHKALGSGEEIRVDDEVYWHADGHAVPVMVACHPLLQNGKITGDVISFIDMSEQRAATKAREQALVVAENLARLRSEFLANMSHEIRTPMNGVLGFAAIGYRNYQDSEKARNAFEKILASGNRLLGVINEVLDFSKIEAGKVSIERTEICLTEVIGRAVELLGNPARAKRLDLRVELAPDLPPTCISDPLRVGQVLLNLLSNAVKFTEVGSVTVSASRQGDKLVFRVTDTGIGMNARQIEHLFNPFQQADGSITRKFGGTGLGLAISKRIVELMGGDIRVESQPGSGSSFEFRVPFVPSAVAATEALPVARIQSTKKPLADISILVAEDDEINQMVLEAVLIEDGARVLMVGNGRQAVERVVEDGCDAYDIVLMDIQMPEMDGYEAARQILEAVPDLPIIGQTAHAFAEDRNKCFAAGMAGHLAKPINPDALVALVQALVAARRDRV